MINFDDVTKENIKEHNMKQNIHFQLRKKKAQA